MASQGLPCGQRLQPVSMIHPAMEASTTAAIPACAVINSGSRVKSAYTVSRTARASHSTP